MRTLFNSGYHYDGFGVVIKFRIIHWCAAGITVIVGPVADIGEFLLRSGNRNSNNKYC